MQLVGKGNITAMMEERRHYRGVLAVALFVYIAVSWGIVFNVASPLVAPVEQALGVSRRSMMWGMTLQSVFSVLGGFLAGEVYDLRLLNNYRKEEYLFPS